MGLGSWLVDRWAMMLRTKPQFMSVLTRKRSSIRSPLKIPNTKRGSGLAGFLCAVISCCSISYGVSLVLPNGIGQSNMTTLMVSITVASLLSISGGLCLSEYTGSQFQVPSIYTCCYQNSSEILAFLIGWTWLISQCSLISSLLKILTAHVNQWSDNVMQKSIENVFKAYSYDVPSLVFLLIFTIFILTGLCETVVWFIVFIPLAFLMVLAAKAAKAVSLFSEQEVPIDFSWNQVQDMNEILTKSAFCILFFSGPQSTVRLPQSSAPRHILTVLGPLNAINGVVAFIFIGMTSFLSSHPVASSNEVYDLAVNVLVTISLCSLTIEAFYPLHLVVEDMSSDGLLWRNLSKKWKPFCFPVASATVHVMTFISVGVMSVFVPLLDTLCLSTLFPLLVDTVVPYLVLNLRYKNNNSWQYEPMFHSDSKGVAHDRSKVKSLEHQYTNISGFDITDGDHIATTCIDEESAESSETDVDAVVQQYKEETKIANLTRLEDSEQPGQIEEPTASSFFRARLCIFLIFSVSVIVAVTLNFADPRDNVTVIIVVLLCVFFSTIIQAVLLCLPQNQKHGRSKNCCRAVPRMPWMPGIASLMASTLLLHCLLQVWKVCLGYFVFGLFFYFLYGIQSSTAANSFYNMRTTHIAMKPLPSYGNNCVPHVVPSHSKSLRAKNRKTKKVLAT